MDVIVEHNRIARVIRAGTPGVPPRPGSAPPPTGPDVIDGTGMYLMPGFVNLHAHLGDNSKAAEAEYVYKLYMAHGVTTIRGVELAPQPFAQKEKARSAANAIVAPRIFNYQRPGAGWTEGVVDTPDKARAWVRWCAANGVDGMKLVAYPPAIMAALLDEAKKLRLGSVAHLEQRGVAQMNALTAAQMGLGTVTHFYGHFEPLLRDYQVQPWPDNMNYKDEQFRFGQVARLWDQIHPPGSPEWKAYLQEHVKLGTIFDPTMTAYAAGRDVMRMRNADWHARYTLPSLMAFYEPSRENHGSYFFDWTLSDEIAWRNFYQVWFKLLNDYKKMGGRVTVERRCGVHLQHVGLRLHPRDGAAAGGRLPPAGGDPRRDHARRRGAARAQGPGPSVRHRPRGHAGGSGARRSESAAEPEGALRHGPRAAERSHRPHRARGRHPLHDQGRHRLRRQEAARRRRGHGGRTAEAAGRGEVVATALRLSRGWREARRG